jgi:dihydroorotate dehydrogenase
VGARVNLYRALRPLIQALDAERAHGLAVWTLAHGFAPLSKPIDDPALRVSLWGLDFPHPIGLAAGFDKDADVPDALLAADTS